MILLKRNTPCIISLTLAELADESKPLTWTIVFTNEQSDDYTVTITPNVINTNSYYQTFELAEGIDFNLPFLGDYEYNVYQTDGMKLVESGMCRLIEEESDTPTYDINDNTVIYGG